MKREVFFCSAPRTDERVEIALNVLDWWKQQDFKLTVFTPKILGCEAYEFQSVRRRVADSIALGKTYIVTDDDCLPLSDPEIGFVALEDHPDFGLISAWPANAHIAKWTPEGYEPFEDLAVTEVNDVGGLRVCRKGAMTKGWPTQIRRAYDREHCEALRAAGWRVGYSQFFRMEHLGEGCSDLWSKALAAYT